MKRKRKGDISGDPVMLEKFIKNRNIINILTLYLVYQSACNLVEGCPSEKMTDEEVFGIIKWNKPKFYSTKQKLIDLELIKICESSNGNYTYVHINPLMPYNYERY
jgi:replication initiation and membrane attachment protein DnaB